MKKKQGAVELEAKVRLLERKEVVVDAIDDIRDHIKDPTLVRKAIAELLVREFGKTNKILGCIIGLTRPEKPSEFVLETVAGANLTRCKAHLHKIILESRKLVKNKNGVVVGMIDRTTHMMSILIQLKGEILGIITLLGTFAFSVEDQKVLEKAEKFIDSLIIDGRKDYLTAHLLMIKRAFYKINNVRNQHLTLPKMLKVVSKKVLEIIKADSCIILLCNKASDDKAKDVLSICATTNNAFIKKVAVKNIILNTADSALEDAELKSWHGTGAPLHSLMCLPLIMDDRKIGVICVANRHEMIEFTREDYELLGAIGKQLETAIFEGLEVQRIREVFGPMVDDRVMSKMLEDPEKIDFSFRRIPDVTVFMNDLRSSTKTLSKVSDEVAGAFNNECLETASNCVQEYDGMVNKFLGDGLMAVFGLPIPQEHAALNAIKAALDLQKANKKIRTRWKKEGIDLPMGIGIFTGRVRAGLVGSKKRFEYTVMGNTVNCTERIQSKAARKPREEEAILVNERTYELTHKHVNFGPPRQIEGKEGEDLIMVYPVIGFRKKAS